MFKTQLAAAAVVARVLSGSSLTVVLQETWRAYPALSKQQKGAIQDISYGVLRFYGQLETILGFLLKNPLTEPQLHYLLLVGLYQLQYSKSSPYTIINQAVTASKSIAHHKALQGLINAVLRTFVRQREYLLQKTGCVEVGCYSYPQWWIDKLREQYPQYYDSLLQQGNQRPPMTLRVSTSKISVQDYCQLLIEKAMLFELTGLSMIQLAQPVNVEKLPGFEVGWVTVQDAGAQLAGIFLDVQNGMRVLDACAAPGGKSTHLLELANVSLTVLDNDANRMQRIEQNLERMKMTVERTVCGDASKPHSWWDGQGFDRILADVPCSASGVVRRHPDIKWLRRESDLTTLIATQQSILNALWILLNRGGKLLYVTCSVFNEENAAQIEKFLNRHEDAMVLSLPLSPFSLSNGQLLPDNGHDGFFYTLLQKK
ncbi:MAG: 16S rRNA (cytosine(967)-C(5))-methyltransferase RsmB [Nitrosomonas sp.]